MNCQSLTIYGNYAIIERYCIMTIKDFIKNNREELHLCIDNVCPDHPRNDNEIRLWINNDEGLYRWARSEGVKI